MYQSIPAVNTPRADPREFFEGKKSTSSGQKRLQNPGPRGKIPGQDKTEEIN